jgi:hypothetical protein
VRYAPLRLNTWKATGAATVLAVLAVATPALAISVTVNGNPITLNPPPIERSGRVFVPLRGVFEQLGASVVYNAGVINATAGSQTVQLTIGSQQATVDGQAQTVDVAPFIVGASTYVPLRFVSQALGATVNYDGANQIVSVVMNGGQQAGPEVPSYATPPQVVVDTPPPPIPTYAQPPCPEPDWIWVPGAWHWGPYGYYWVPGTWEAPPQPGYLWTPGYWAFTGGNYGWHSGYWGIHIGFYGGINYGAGYFGNGYEGGHWDGNHFAYNTAVTNVNKTVITNTYINKTVVNNYYNTKNVSYNGGPEGVKATPTAAEKAAFAAKHVPATPVQAEHIKAAAADRRLLATVNHGKPPVTVVERPITPEHPLPDAEPVKPEDKALVQGHTIKGEGPGAVEKPAMEKPAEEKPAMEKPAEEKPAMEKPAEEKPAMEKPAEEKPAMEKPATEKPAMEKPAEEKPAMEKPAEEKPAMEKPATEKPAMEKPAMEKPAMEKPAEKPKPVVHHPAAKKPAPKKPAPKPEEKPAHPEEKPTPKDEH